MFIILLRVLVCSDCHQRKVVVQDGIYVVLWWICGIQPVLVLIPITKSYFSMSMPTLLRNHYVFIRTAAKTIKLGISID